MTRTKTSRAAKWSTGSSSRDRDLLHAIGSDPNNRVVILAGSGNAFMETIAPDGFDFLSPRGYNEIDREGNKVLMNILDMEVPMIATVNGPVRQHSEYIPLADIVLATPAVVFQDKPHLIAAQGSAKWSDMGS
jgi:enoyl-CoA hydratase/carnithine racemase